MTEDAPGWTYDRRARRYVPADPDVLPPAPPPYEVPPGTPYPDWPRCDWPTGCTIGVKAGGACSPHRELAVAHGHEAQPDPAALGETRHRPCLVCGQRGLMHGLLRGLEVAAALVWLEDHPEATGDRTPAPMGVALQREVQRATGVKVRRDARQTSRDAAARALPGAETQAGRVLRCIVGAGVDGITDEQVSERLGLPLNTVRPRRLELVERELVLDSGDTTSTATGAQAILWLATLAGITAAERTDP